MTAIRPAQPADTPHIHRLIRGLAEYERMLHHFSATETDLHAALFSPQPSAYALLAEHHEAPIGLALFYYTLNTFKARRGIFLEDLFVEPKHRGHGTGLALMRALAQRAATEGCSRIEWRVLNWNQPSIDFYQRIGAEQITDWQTRQLTGEALARLAKGHSDG
jgi:GNAT superfamily N-acetyltransferase